MVWPSKTDENFRMLEGREARSTLQQASQLFAPAASGADCVAELLRVDAQWTHLYEAVPQSDNPGRRHQSIRNRGVTPTYPRPGRFATMTPGTLVMFRNGFVLEPDGRRHSCINISAASVRSAFFYDDAFEVLVDDQKRLVIRTEPVEHVDSIFQAYFWNPLI